MTLYTDTKEHVSCTEIQACYTCPRLWLQKYVLKVPAKKSDALLFGIYFHEYLEGKTPSFEGLRADIPYETWCKVMADNLWLSLDRNTITHAEKWVRGRQFLGKLDGLQTLPGGRWRLVEFKTTAQLNEERKRTMNTDLQINGYLAHKAEIAESVDLDPALFDGIMYAQCLKPKSNSKIENFKPRTIIDHIAPAYVKNASKTFAVAKRHAMFVMDSTFYHFENGGMDNVSFNSAACQTAYGPCDYFEHCHPAMLPTPKAPEATVSVPAEFDF